MESLSSLETREIGSKTAGPSDQIQHARQKLSDRIAGPSEQIQRARQKLVEQLAKRPPVTQQELDRAKEEIHKQIARGQPDRQYIPQEGMGLFTNNQNTENPTTEKVRRYAKELGYEGYP